MENPKTIIFTDGSSLGNPGSGGYCAIIVAPSVVIEIGGNEKRTTNNRMELTAVIEALRHEIDSEIDTHIYVDSRYVVGGATSWLQNWKKSGWIGKNKQEIANRDLWEKLDNVMSVGRKTIQWHHVEGHVGITGNERADKIATTFAEGNEPKLYSGPLSSYDLRNNIFNTEIDEDKAEKKRSTKARSAGKALYYMSLVDGKLEEHKTWLECEKRVKGLMGVRFRKVTKPDERLEILKDWGLE